MKRGYKFAIASIGVIFFLMTFLVYGETITPFNNGDRFTSIIHINLSTDEEYVEDVDESRVYCFSDGRKIVVKLAKTNDFPERKFVLKRTRFKDPRFSGRIYKSSDKKEDAVYAFYTEMCLVLLFDDDNYETHMITIY